MSPLPQAPSYRAMCSSMQPGQETVAAEPCQVRCGCRAPPSSTEGGQTAPAIVANTPPARVAPTAVQPTPVQARLSPVPELVALHRPHHLTQLVHTGAAGAAGRAPAAARPALPHLAVEVVELICSPLALTDRCVGARCV